MAKLIFGLAKSDQEKEVEAKVNGFKRKHGNNGFTEKEISELANLFPEMDMGYFEKGLAYNTWIEHKGEYVISIHDVLTAVWCGIEKEERGIIVPRWP
jgi:hypothetical protein